MKNRDHITLSVDQGLLIQAWGGNTGAVTERGRRRDQTLKNVYLRMLDVVETHGSVTGTEPSNDGSDWRSMSTDSYPTQSPSHELVVVARGRFNDDDRKSVTVGIRSLITTFGVKSEHDLIGLRGYGRNDELQVNPERLALGDFRHIDLPMYDLEQLDGVVGAIEDYYS